MADSSRFEELQKASARDVKAVGMVGASTGLEMVEYIRILERRLNQAIAAHAMIVWMASNYAMGGGDNGPENQSLKTSQKLYDLARDGYDGELNPSEWPEEGLTRMQV